MRKEICLRIGARLFQNDNLTAVLFVVNSTAVAFIQLQYDKGTGTGSQFQLAVCGLAGQVRQRIVFT